MARLGMAHIVYGYYRSADGICKLTQRFLLSIQYRFCNSFLIFQTSWSYTFGITLILLFFLVILSHINFVLRLVLQPARCAQVWLKSELVSRACESHPQGTGRCESTKTLYRFIAFFYRIIILLIATPSVNQNSIIFN